MSESQDEVLSVRDVAKLLHLEERSVREILKSRQLQGHKTGRRWWVPQGSVDAYLKSVQPRGSRSDPALGREGPLLLEAKGKHRDDLLNALDSVGKAVQAQITDGPFEYGLATEPTFEFSRPEIDEARWSGLERHLGSLSLWKSWVEWSASRTAELEGERAVHELAQTVGERVFGVPLLLTTPEKGGRLCHPFPGAVVAYTRTYASPAAAIGSRHQPTWEGPGHLTFAHNYWLTERLSMPEAEARVCFSKVLEQVMGSIEAERLREFQGQSRVIGQRLAREITRYLLRHHLTGECDSCPDKPYT